MARDCMSSSSTVRLTPAPSPTRAMARRTRRKFYYSLRSLLVPTTLVREIIILFGIYMSFSRFQYELLVHTPNTDVYRRILECRFTHFAPYVALSLAPRPSTLAHVVDVQQFIRSHIARMIYTAVPLLLDFPEEAKSQS